jgi:hypothetical protein
MNKDVFEGKWKQVRGEAKVWWASSPTMTWTRSRQFEVPPACFRKNMVIPASGRSGDQKVNEYEASLKQSMPSP